MSLLPLLCSVGMCVVVARPMTAADSPSPREFSPAERLQREHLAGTHAAVEAISQSRRTLPARAGFHDYRAIFHAHAGDSAHTGGTAPELLADARRAGVQAVFLSDHHRPPRDFMESWRGLHDGVLFVPGSEARGFLLHPMASIAAQMEAPVPELIQAVNVDGGLAFLSHIEERPEHTMTGLQGLEIYNRHYDAKRDMVGLIALAMRLTDPAELAELQELLRLYPDELLAAQVRRPQPYLDKWDQETGHGLRLTGIGANDCHHNQIFIVKMVDDATVRVGTNVDKDQDLRVVSAALRPGIRALVRGHQPGDVVARVDFDPYYRSLRNLSTHLLAPELTETALRAALVAGHAYVSHDWLCDPTGFRFVAGPAQMGDEVKLGTNLELQIEVPAPCHLRLLRQGVEVAAVAGNELRYAVKEPGVYRCEATFFIGGDIRPWIYSNPIYVR